MRIGICTQPLTTNYGGILQNYALQIVLKRMGHDVWTLDYHKHSWLDWMIVLLKTIICKLMGKSAVWMSSPRIIAKQERPLRRFVKSNISLTIPRTKWFSKKVVYAYDFDAIIVGSDQVWRPLYNTHIEDLFLSFVQELDIKKIAYAASFGTDEWEFTTEQTEKCSALAQSFDAISVREISGVNLCKHNLLVQAVHVLDPTLLLSNKDYIDLCKNTPTRNPFVFAYILDENDHIKAEIQKFAQAKNLPYFILSAGSRVSDNDSIEKWLSYFRDAAYVITDSFHGTAFSINFEKDFYVFINSSRGNARLNSLLTLLNLSDRMVLNHIPILGSIKYKEVRLKLNLERKRSLTWLNDNLQNTKL